MFKKLKSKFKKNRKFTPPTYLLQDVIANDLEKVKNNFKNNHDLTIQDSDGNTALLLASREGHLDALKFFIEKGGNIEEKNNFGNTALMLAAEKGNLHIVKFLIEQGAILEAQNANGRTALQLAQLIKHAVHNTSNVLYDDSYRLSNTIDFLAKNTKETSSSIVDNHYLEDIKIFLSHDANEGEINSAFISAAYNGNIEIVKYLLQFSSISDWIKGIALCTSANAGHLQLTKFLIESGADVNHFYGIHDATPLMEAVKGKSLDMVKLLVEKGAKIDTLSNSYCGSPLQVAASINSNTWFLDYNPQDQINIIQFILKCGPSLEDKNRALMIAADGGNLDVVKLLLQHGANINARNDRNETPLLVSITGNSSLFKFLLDQGANLRLKDKDGYTALLKVALLGNEKEIDILFKHGLTLGDLEAKTNKGETFLSLLDLNSHFKFSKEKRKDIIRAYKKEKQKAECVSRNYENNGLFSQKYNFSEKENANYEKLVLR